MLPGLRRNRLPGKATHSGRHEITMKIIRVFIVVIVVAVTSVCAAAMNSDQPSQVVLKFHSELIEVMKNAKELGYKGRYKKLKPVVLDTFDFPYISRIVVGSYWPNLTDQEKKNFIEAFENLSIATYADRFNDYSGERFEVISEDKYGRDQLVLKTALVESNGNKVELDYILRSTPSGYKVINVIADGVSDLSMKRAECRSVIKKKGIDGLLKTLCDKLDEFSN
jgi:phospholipid transport system substrate-binding protein